MCRHFALMSLLGLLLTGCGRRQQTSSTAKAAPPLSAKTAATPDAESPPVTEPDAELAADAFATPEDAVSALKSAAAEGDSLGVAQISHWLSKHHVQLGLSLLSELLSDERASTPERIAATQALRHLGPGAAEPLRNGVKAGQSRVRISAVKALGTIRPLPDGVVDTLAGWIDHDDPEVRQAAIRSLRLIGAPAASCTDRLTALLNNPQENDTLRAEAKAALKKINPRRTLVD